MSVKKKIFRALEALLLAVVVIALIWVYVSVSGEVLDILHMGEE